MEIAKAVRDHPLVVVRSADAVGKDGCAARLALWWVYARRGLALVTGPTERQVVEVVMGEVARAFSKAEDLPGELYQMALRLGRADHAGILAFTSTEASRGTGFHAPRVFAVLTEAQGVDDWVFESLLACATGTEDRVLAVGNPLVPSGTFYTASMRSDAWEAIRISASESPNVREGRTVVPGLITRSGVERFRVAYGEGSPVYVARVEGEFPDQGEEGLLRRSWLEAAAERWAEWRETFAEKSPVVAVDPARYGPDRTAVCVLRGSCVTRLEAWAGRMDLAEVVERVRGLLEEEGVKPGRVRGEGIRVVASRSPWDRPDETPPARGTVVVDEVGLGGGVLDRLKELGYRARGFNSGTKAHNPEPYANARAAAYWRLRELLEAGQIALPADEDLFSELLAIRWRADCGRQGSDRSEGRHPEADRPQPGPSRRRVHGVRAERRPSRKALRPPARQLVSGREAVSGSQEGTNLQTGQAERSRFTQTRERAMKLQAWIQMGVERRETRFEIRG